MTGRRDARPQCAGFQVFTGREVAQFVHCPCDMRPRGPCCGGRLCMCSSLIVQAELVGPMVISSACHTAIKVKFRLTETKKQMLCPWHEQ